MSRIFGTTVANVENTMRFRLQRQSVLSGNVANAETPGYRRFDLKLKNELKENALPLTGRRSGHLSSEPGRAPRIATERGEYGLRPDRNGVDLDDELLTMSRNAGAFTTQAEVLSRLLSMRRMAITGEAR